MKTDVLIIGGGAGGCAAALAAASMGSRVIMTEETDWIGGQLTSQAVPPDENPWIEQFGSTALYRRFRDGVRAYYRTHYPLTAAARARRYLNPGNGYVSRICHEPRVGLAVLQEMLASYVSGGRVTVLLRHKAIAVETDGDRVRLVQVRNLESGRQFILEAPYVLDATELGDLLPLAGVEHVIGAESQRDTGEPHAVDGDPLPLAMQGITYCFAMDYLPEEDHTIDKPAEYDFWRQYKPDFWPGPLLSWTYSNPFTLKPQPAQLFPGEHVSLWMYRRIADRENFTPGTYPSDITLVNWPQNDYWLRPIIGVPEEEAKRHLDRAKQLSLSLVYWLQTEAPRPDGGQGYPGLRVRKDVVGTEDGLAKYPYIRESRRIRAEFTVKEQHVGVEARPGAQGAENFPDSVGIGCYRIDLHPDTAGRNYVDIASWPYQIPLGALIPERVENLLAACKNLGVTHITNGCYRLHPVEWNIGEAAGYLAAYCVAHGVRPRQVRNDAEKLAHFQRVIADHGVELRWPAIHSV